jgi:hypothetical protein
MHSPMYIKISFYVVPENYGTHVPKTDVSYKLQIRRMAFQILRNAKHHFLCDDARTVVWRSFLVTRQWRHCRRRKRTESGLEGRGNNRFSLFLPATYFLTTNVLLPTRIRERATHTHQYMNRKKRILSLKILWRHTPSFPSFLFRASLHN